MYRAPRFDNEWRFDPRRILLTDIDGSRTADLQPQFDATDWLR
jgi:hypothetical protein